MDTISVYKATVRWPYLWPGQHNNPRDQDDMRLSALLWLAGRLSLSGAIQEAEPGQFPYTVSLQVSQYEG